MSDAQHVYSDKFFDYISEGSQKSARAFCKVLEPLFANREDADIIDVGSGQGAWTREFSKIPNVKQAVGVDGTYVNVDQLVIPPEDFVPHDLTTPLNLGRKFTLAVSLEVGEHLPKAAAAVLVKTLVDHADIVLFSAAIPGQGGESHINEQPLTFWRSEFARHDYVALDVIRPKLVGQTDVAPWYRYNCILYVTKDKLAQLPAELTGEPVTGGEQFQSFASPIWKLRCAILRVMPRPIIEILAQMKHAWVRRTRSLHE